MNCTSHSNNRTLGKPRELKIMHKVILLSLFALIQFTTYSKAQSPPGSDLDQNIENPKYLDGDLAKVLFKNIRYPREAARRNISGDVILEFTIQKDGRLENLNVVNSPPQTLTASSIAAFNQLNGSWSQPKVDGKPSNRKYYIIIRYYSLLNKKLPDYNKRADKYLKKEKYNKALDIYDRAIKNNRFSYKLYESRSILKNILGDINGSEEDRKQSVHLKYKVLLIMNIFHMQR